jgi:hypothetical protein
LHAFAPYATLRRDLETVPSEGIEIIENTENSNPSLSAKYIIKSISYALFSEKLKTLGTVRLYEQFQAISGTIDNFAMFVLRTEIATILDAIPQRGEVPPVGAQRAGIR